MTNDSQITELAGLHTLCVGNAGRGDAVVVLLHGYDMMPEDLAPFGSSLKVPALFLFPRGPMPVPHTASLRGGYSWWNIDFERKQEALRHGPRDLAAERPAGLDDARTLLGEFLLEVQRRHRPRQIILGGFSQGGMLACDWAVHGSSPVDGLILLSTSRIDFRNWQSRRHGLRGMSAFVSHGLHDGDLAFGAGEQLCAFLEGSGAAVTWQPFDGGHEIPLLVWRALRSFLTARLTIPLSGP